MEKKEDVMITSDLDIYIKRLEEEKEKLELKIKEIQAEVVLINNLIYRNKSKTLAEKTGKNINLKNIDSLFFESIIIDLLKTSKRGLRTRGIYEELKKMGYGINYNTLRSYVTKMRDKEQIKKITPTSYYWVYNQTE